MRDKVPTVTEFAWISAVPQCIVMALLIGAAFLFFDGDRPKALMAGAGVYLLWSRGSKALIAGHHARGIALLRQGKFREAIAEFEGSYAFFTRHRWIDRSRYLVLLSSSAYSYRELALCNIAFARMQLGEVGAATATYRRAVSEFPACTLARLSLQTIETVQREGDS